MKYTLFTAIYLMWALIGGCSQHAETVTESPTPVSTASNVPQFYPLTLASENIQVELACTSAEQSKGLMFRKSLPSNQGMLFIFKQEQILAFWMKNTLIPLDIAYIDKTGTIVDIQTMAAETTQTYPSKMPAQYALEMNENWFSENNIATGTQITLPDCPETP